MVKYGVNLNVFVKIVHTSGELKCTGNCLKGSRQVISFDNAFA